MTNFPAGFLWGTATAAHQVEGDNRLNDWWEWEQVPGHVRDGQRSGAACDHYRRFRDDFALLRSFHQNAHRFSIEWSRVEPTQGQYSVDAIDHYREVLDSLGQNGLEPMVTLHHFTNPSWLARAGGWLAPDTPQRFASFVDRVMAELGHRARLWITINEPTVIAYQSYIRGGWPPQHQDRREAVQALANLVRGHWLAYERIKNRQPGAQVGLAHNLRLFDPARMYSMPDRLIAWLYHRLFNMTVLQSLRRGRLVFPLDRASPWHGPRPSQDFLGLNYYTRDRIRFNRHKRLELFADRVNTPGAPQSNLGWEIYPEGLYRLLRLLAREGLPIYITENGVADADDTLRSAFLSDHVSAARRAIDAGVPLRGYFHWTSFDNFEWAEGYSAKFGLIASDPVTQERRPRASARLYAEFCRRNSIATAQ